MLPLELLQWAHRYGVSEAALAELSGILGAPTVARGSGSGSESRVQSLVRLAAPALGFRLFRNNKGALPNAQGVPVRYGLANDSKALGRQLRSSDLIGWRRRPITADMVGCCVAQFTALECKPEGWTYRGDEHEQGQARWLGLVAADGGHAKFVTRAEDI